MPGPGRGKRRYIERSAVKNDLSSEQPVPQVPSCWELIHDVVIFQVKLAIDALRDLTIIRIIIDRHGVESIPGQGTRFFVSLPADDKLTAPA
ncbi:MAG: hypothetical protein V3W14_06605 [Candidatus Neomarinimicrobiota bacterium]